MTLRTGTQSTSTGSSKGGPTGIHTGSVNAVVWAAAQALSAITLTTFTKVAWNGPYYERLGFRYLPEDQIGPELREIRRQEARRGLDAWPRACMWRPVQ